MSRMFVLSEHSGEWQRACRLVNYLLREGAELRWATEPFKALTSEGQTLALARGDYLIADLKHVSQAMLNAAQARYGIQAQAVDSLRGFVGLLLQPLRIALYGGGGAPFNHARIFAELGFHSEFISPQEVRAGMLDEYDLFGVPGGGGLAMIGQLTPLGEDGCRRIKDWVQRGGMYIGSCAGSFDAAIVAESFLEVCPQQRQMQLVNALIWNRGDTEWIGLESPGVGVIKSRNLQPDHPVMFGLPERFDITHYNGPLFDTDTAVLPDASAAKGLAAVAGARDDFTPSERFLSFSQPRQLDATLLGRAAKEGRFNIVSGYNGLGRVLLFGSHPEFGYNLAMDNWGAPARMLANAAYWQSAQLGAGRPTMVKRERGIAQSHPLGSGLSRIAEACGAINNAVEALHDLATDNATWLDESHAMSVFGMSGREVWQRGLGDFADLTGRMHVALERANNLLKRADALLNNDGADADQRKQVLSDMLSALEEAVHHQTPAEWRQDFGYEGVLQMLSRAESMLRRAKDNGDSAFDASDNPYAYFESSPYQLVVGSYLAANGVALNSWQLLQAHLLRIEEQIFAIDAAALN